MIKPKPLPFPALKRSALRKARARIAAGAVPVGTRDFTATVTRVIPLADPMSDAVWSVAREAALTLRGLGPGSLFDLVLRAHASGWRFFASGKEREAFFLKRMFDSSEFNRLAAAAFGAEMSGFTAENLRAVLGAPPRKVGKEASAPVLAERLARAVGVKKADLANPPAILARIADALCAEFGTWAQIAAVDGGVGNVIDRILRDAGREWPSLARGWSQSLPQKHADLGVPTLAFDDEAPQIEEATAGSLFAGVVARYLREAEDGADPSKVVQSCVTTPNGNALSWLFGVGRRGLRTLSEADLAAGLNITSPRGSAALAALRAHMIALPALSALGERAYPDARASLQGSVDSLIANYVKRLVELQADVEKISAEDIVVPDVVAGSDAYSAVYAGMPFRPSDLLALYAELQGEVAKLRAALAVLLGSAPAGRGGFQAAINAVDAFGGWVMRVNAVIRQVNARIKQLDQPESLLITPLLGGEKWKALVGLTPPEGPAVEIIPQLDAQLQALLHQCDVAYARIVDRYSPTLESALANTRDQVRDAYELAARKLRVTPPNAVDLDLMARRKMLDAVTRLVRRGAPSLAHALLREADRQGLTRKGTASERALRGHLLSGEQEIYAHPLSKTRRLVALEREALGRLDIEAMLQALEDDADQRSSLREAVLVSMTRQSLLLSGLPERIEAASLSWEMPAQVTNAPWADLRAINGEIARSELIKAFSATFHSSVAGLLYRLNRTRFMERYDIRCFVGPTLLFAPRDANWKPPVQYRHGTYAAWLNHPGFPWAEDGAAVNGLALARWLVSSMKDVDAAQQAAGRALLAQLPHDWVVCCDFEGAPQHEGVFASDGEVSGWMKRKGYRLNPPRHFGGALLEGFKRTGISPHSLTFERMLEREGDTVVERERRVTAAIPLAQPVTPSEQRWAPRFMMGLDLGEAGLGVCLKHVETGEEQVMLLRTRKTFRLARHEEHYRRRQQPRQTFRKQYNESPENAIKAAIGEVCGLVDNLIARYDAVPVFESQAAAARGSNKMVARVYAGVLQRYTYVLNNQAAQAVRQSHWLGAGRWTYAFGSDVLPVARQLGRDAMASTRNPDAVFRDALGTPGVMASGYRTSMICAGCNTDSVALIDAAAEAGQVAFTTDSEGYGVLQLPTGTQSLRVEAPTSSRAVQVAARRRKRRSPWEALANQTWVLTRKRDRDELSKTVRRSLRRPPASIQASASSSWEFHCPCCQRIEQADVNAAMNLVRRYYDRVRETHAARASWDLPDTRVEFSQARAIAA